MQTSPHRRATRARHRARGFTSARGFTLIELLIVIAIIGIITVLLLPNFLDAIQKSKQKRSMGDIKIVGTALMAWLTDQSGGAAAAGKSQTIDLTRIPIADVDGIEDALVPQYLQKVPLRDAWKEPLEYRIDFDDPQGELVFSIRSLGRDLTAEGTTYTVGPFEPTDYDRDLVWVDGGFARWPETGS